MHECVGGSNLGIIASAKFCSVQRHSGVCELCTFKVRNLEFFADTVLFLIDEQTAQILVNGLNI